MTLLFLSFKVSKLTKTVVVLYWNLMTDNDRYEKSINRQEQSAINRLIP